jgi:hypothetical protein
VIFERWFQAETPHPRRWGDEVTLSSLLMVHRIVEIDEVEKSGLELERGIL